jgi:anti-sigma factor RsiW
MREHRWTSVHASAYLDGELSAAERARVEEHAGLCPECRQALRELRRTLEGLMGLRPVCSEGVADRVIDRLRREPGTPSMPSRPNER